MDAPTAAPGCADERWNFVQMNMSLLPIARPLPVHTSIPFSRRNDKPRTPIHQVVGKTLSISPRRQGEIGHTIPVELSLRECVLRKDKRGVKREREEKEQMIQTTDETQLSCDFGSVRVKRILEILDEDRTVKEDSMHAISPRKNRAQKLLVAKSLAAKREKQTALECKQIADGSRQEELTRKKTIALEQKKSHATKLLLHYVNKDLATFALKSPTKSTKLSKKSKDIPQEPIASTKVAVVDDLRIEEDDKYHRPPRPRPVNPWAKMYELEVKEVKEEEQKRRQNHLEKMQQTRKTLDHQHEEKLKRKAEDQKLELEQYKLQQQQLAQYKIDLENAQLAKERKQKEANADFARMIEEARIRKDKQHQIQVRAELQEVERAKLALEMERQRLEREKQLKAKEVERVKLENKALQEIKRQALLKEQEDDRRTTKEYQERLAQQERKRLEALEQTYARQEKRVNLALLNVVSEAEKALIDEKRAQKIQAEIEAREDARYRQKQKQLEESNAIQKLALKKQQDERLQAMKNEIEYNRKADKDWIEDTLAAEMKERAKQAKKHAQDKAYREKLALQMLNEQKKRETTDKWAMDKTEMILNADRLRKAGIQVKPKD